MIKAATENPGPPAINLVVKGMNCGHCVATATGALQAVAGVATAEVTLEGGRARVRWRPDAGPDPTALIAALRSAGFEAQEVAAPPTKPGPGSRVAGWGFNVVVGSACTLPLMIGEWLFPWGMERWFHWFSFLLATTAQFLCGARFYRGAWLRLRSGSSNMDTLVSLGSTTAFAYSVWALFSGVGGHLFFMEAASILTLISLGHWLEARASSQSEMALRALLHLAPQRARRQGSTGHETEVAVTDLRINDVVRLRPGDRVPTDGEVAQGQASFDETMLTGESQPVEKQVGHTLYAGTVNLDGQVLMRVNATGEATALAHIIAVVQRAQHSRASIQRLADRVSNVFVPLVVLVALATGLWWGLAPEYARAVAHRLVPYLWSVHLPASALAGAVLAAAAVLIVACPCAMGLATPAAIMVGTNVAARRGILIRDGIALEKAGKITTLIFDKTGTLTRGRPTVAATCVLVGERPTALALAASLAGRSNHPLSRSVAVLTDERVSLSQWQEVRGAGVQADMPGSGATVRLGSLPWLEHSGIGVAGGAEFAQGWMRRGATVLGLSRDKELLALVALEDALKPGAAAVVRRLAQDLKVMLITGDNSRTVRAVAEQVGIDPQDVFAETRPEQKAELVRQFQSRGERVAFVGDGINDAPALEQSDLGIAVSQASDVANEAADMILLKSGIEAIPEALELARATLRTIHQNLFWALFYNAAAVPLAALGLLSPMVCAATMALSDLAVIGNALRLRRFRLAGAGAGGGRSHLLNI